MQSDPTADAGASHHTHTPKTPSAMLPQPAPAAASAAEPMSIDRPSIAAYWPPCFKSARVSVAKPTEGAAPKRPAKLFGRKMSPSNANAETTIPPARKRMTYSKTVPFPGLFLQKLL